MDKLTVETCRALVSSHLSVSLFKMFELAQNCNTVTYFLMVHESRSVNRRIGLAHRRVIAFWTRACVLEVAARGVSVPAKPRETTDFLQTSRVWR